MEKLVSAKIDSKKIINEIEKKLGENSKLY